MAELESYDVEVILREARAPIFLSRASYLASSAPEKTMAEPGHLVERVAQWRDLAVAFPPPTLGLCLDLGHLAANREGELEEVLTPADTARLHQVHLEDARHGRHLHLEPGQGELDIPALLATLARRGYRGPVCWELGRSGHRAAHALAAAWACWPGSG